MQTDLSNLGRLKKMLEEKIQRVQQAELQGTWGLKAIEKETEFLTLVLELIYNYEAISIDAAKADNSTLEDSRRLLLTMYFHAKLYQFNSGKHVDISYELFESYFAVATDNTKMLAARILLKYYEQEIRLEDAPKCIAYWQRRINMVQPFTTPQ